MQAIVVISITTLIIGAAVLFMRRSERQAAEQARRRHAKAVRMARLSEEYGWFWQEARDIDEWPTAEDWQEVA